LLRRKYSVNEKVWIRNVGHYKRKFVCHYKRQWYVQNSNMPNNNNVLKFTDCPISEGMFPVNSLSRSDTEASDMNVGSDGESNAEKKDEQREGARDKKILQTEFCNSLNAVNRPISDGKVLVNSF
jgi:hypothetical protein